MRKALTALALAGALIASGCGEEQDDRDLLPNGLAADEEARAVIEEVQAQVAAGDAGAGCEFVHRERASDAPCDDGDGDVLAFTPPPGQKGFGDAGVVFVWVDKHGQSGEVQLDNGARVGLLRAGTSADLEWRVTGVGY